MHLTVKRGKEKNAELRLKIGRIIGVSLRNRKIPLWFFGMLWSFFLPLLCDSVMVLQPLELSSKFFLVQVCTIDPDRC